MSKIQKFVLGAFVALVLVPAFVVAPVSADTAIVVSSCGTPPTTYTAGQNRPTTMDTNGQLCANGGTQTVTGTVAATQSGTWTVQPGNTANTTPWLVGGYSTIVSASVTRPNNTTTYTANTGINTATAASSPGYMTFSALCRANAGQILIPEIDIYSSANQSTKLQGVLWLFDTVVGTPINDNATFNIAAADYANLTGNIQGFPFTMVSNQASGAANAGISLTGTTYHAHCASGATAVYGILQAVNAYVPIANEVFTVKLHAVAAN